MELVNLSYVSRCREEVLLNAADGNGFPHG
jgi:hypothetical protein